MAIVDPYDAILLDLDGVLYLGDRAIPGAAEAVARMRLLGKRVAFVTNNSSRTPEEVAGKLSALGVPADPTEVETSALATADLLSARGTRTAFVVGDRGIREALELVGIQVLDGDPQGVDVVVVGFDSKVDYGKLARASLLVGAGAALVATNADASYPTPEGEVPGAGALLASIETTTGSSAEVIGKPHPPLLEAALAKVGGGLPLLVGDRIDTDIVGAASLGWDSVLVLTGVSGRDDLTDDTTRPTYVVSALSELF